MEKVKLGIIGMGRMGLTHYSIINSNEKVEIVAISDSSTLITSIIKKYTPQLQTYRDYEDLINKSKPDALIVCTPPVFHYKICKYAYEHGINVFCEKPFTTDLEQANELKNLFEFKHLVNQVGYVNRFNDAFSMVKKYLDDNLIGDIIRFKSEMYSRTIIEKEKGDSWRSKRENGGGVTYEMASHAIDLVNYIIGVPDKIVGTGMNQIYSKNVEDVISSTFLYKNGICGTLYVNWSDTSYRKPSNRLEIFGLKGKILVDQYGIKIYMNEINKKYDLRQGWNTIHITDIFTPVPFYVRGMEFTRQLYYFIDTILGKNDGSMCTFNDGTNVQIIIKKIFDNYQLYAN
jgi:predicted dehydrogenase